jgi:hypothetical protein
VRKHLSLLGGALITAAILAVAFVLALGRPSAPFEFLAGRHSIAWQDSVKRDRRKYSDSWTGYTFQADYQQLLNAARTELLAKGYREVSERVSPSQVAFRPRKLTPETYMHQVICFKDRRATSTIALQPSRGWVSVLIMDRPPKATFFDHLRSWLGL